jgi:hypothetical protein
MPCESQVEHDDESDDSDDEPAEARLVRGSFPLGFVAGLLGGLVVVALVARRGKRDTKRGVYWGFGVQVVILLLNAIARR